LTYATFFSIFGCPFRKLAILIFTMMKKLIRKALPLLLLFVFSLYSTAQNEANVWYFGEYAGIDFNTGIPIPLIGFTHTVSAASSICDSTGNFLMFSNGQKIWNADRQIMLNGDDLVGRHMSTQGALILQKPGSTNLYYVFTVGHLGWVPSTYGLHYSIVDITLDNGKGGVTAAKNVLLNAAWDAFREINGS